MVAFLGRNCARAGRFADAFLFLDSSRDEYASAGLHGDVARIDAWYAEALSLSGDAAGALALADTTLRTVRAEGGTSPEVPLLKRVRAESLWTLGDAEAAGKALPSSVAAAGRAMRNTSSRSRSTFRMPELRAYFDDVDALLAERDAVFERLGVVVVTL